MRADERCVDLYTEDALRKRHDECIRKILQDLELARLMLSLRPAPFILPKGYKLAPQPVPEDVSSPPEDKTEK